MYRVIPTPIVLVLVLTVLTCLVSYWADNLGKKLGKKRISILGLRPRQTATLLTMLSSVGIMMGTLLVLTLFVNQVRDAFLRSDRLNDRNVELLSENQSLEQTLKASQRRVGESRRLAQQAQKDENAAVAKTRTANQRATEARRRAASAQSNLKNVQSRLVAAEAARTAAQRGEASAIRNASLAQRNATAARGRLSAAQSRLNATQTRLDTVRNRLSRAKNVLLQTQAGLKTKQNELRQAQIQTNIALNLKANAKGAAVRVSRKALEIQREVTVQKIRLEQDQSQINALEKQRRDLEIQVRGQQANLERIRLAAEQVVGGRFVVARDQVFAERVIAAGLDRAGIEAQLRALMEDANRAVKAPPVRAASLRLAPLWIDYQGRRVELNEREVLDSLTNFIADFSTPVAVRLAAARNYTESESELQGVMVAVPVRVAFARDTTIAAMTIEGKQSEARIFNQLLALANEGESVARGRGVVPPLSPDAPNFFAAGTNERIFEALRRVQQHEGAVGVRLVAADDLSTVEPLRVRFEVGTASSS